MPISNGEKGAGRSTGLRSALLLARFLFSLLLASLAAHAQEEERPDANGAPIAPQMRTDLDNVPDPAPEVSSKPANPAPAVVDSAKNSEPKDVAGEEQVKPNAGAAVPDDAAPPLIVEIPAAAETPETTTAAAAESASGDEAAVALPAAESPAEDTENASPAVVMSGDMKVAKTRTIADGEGAVATLASSENVDAVSGIGGGTPFSDASLPVDPVPEPSAAEDGAVDRLKRMSAFAAGFAALAAFFFGLGLFVSRRTSPADTARPLGPFVFRAGESSVAVLGDIHGNLEALNAVLADIKAQGVKQIVCTGDIVGYGANPLECIKAMRKTKCPVVLGNHDQYCVSDDTKRKFKEAAEKTIHWTRRNLGEKDLSFLRSLPYQMPLGRLQLVHSSLWEPERWDYVLSREAAEASMENQSAWICLVGHTHVPMVFEAEGRIVKSIAPESAALRRDRKYLINPGSVGQPRDGDPRAAYGILDLAAGNYRLRRVGYMIQEAQRKILDAGLPEHNAMRLAEAK